MAEEQKGPRGSFAPYIKDSRVFPTIWALMLYTVIIRGGGSWNQEFGKRYCVSLSAVNTR
ncbi:hypothetical protein BDW60DRAFT_93189 [Aspergillus nidulans var. acristatus]